LETNTVLPDAVQAYLEAGRAKLLSREKYSFHNWYDHILPMRDKAVELGEKMELSGEDIRLLEIAVLFHDIGLPEGREGHEERGAEIAEAILIELGEKEENIEKVKKMVVATEGQWIDNNYVYKPSDDPLVLAMRDVDMANVGDENYEEINENLRKENNVQDETEWVRFQIKFLTKHKFQTREAEELWGEQKKKNLKYLQSKLRTDLSF